MSCLLPRDMYYTRNIRNMPDKTYNLMDRKTEFSPISRKIRIDPDCRKANKSTVNQLHIFHEMKSAK